MKLPPANSLRSRLVFHISDARSAPHKPGGATVTTRSLDGARPVLYAPAQSLSKKGFTMPPFHRVSILAAAAVAVPAFSVSANVAPTRNVAQAKAAPRAAAAPTVVTRTSFTKGIDARFAALDTNKDGSLSDSEIAAGQTQAVQRVRGAQHQRLEAQFKKLDTNKDGALSMAEFTAAARPVRSNGSSEQRLKAIDSNKDGKVSLQEYRSRPLASFDRMDANKDGTVTAQELRAARKR